MISIKQNIFSLRNFRKYPALKLLHQIHERNVLVNRIVWFNLSSCETGRFKLCNSMKWNYTWCRCVITIFQKLSHHNYMKQIKTFTNHSIQNLKVFNKIKLSGYIAFLNLCWGISQRSYII